MNKQPVPIIFILLIFAKGLIAQTDFPKNYFISPLFIPINLAGNFGEIRSDHFHSGLDIKTYGCEGEPVVAAADGYVSRIKISAFGFGKAIYINHPNGFTTVYAHLQRFNDSIQFYVESEQYKKESFEIDLSVDSNLFPLKKGQLIAYSGNTGGSEGPHLHFEIRNTKSEHPINPLLFGFVLEDTIAPVIKNIRLYQLQETKYGLWTDTAFHLNDNNSASLSNDTFFISEQTAFSVETSDKMNDTTSDIVVNKIELLLDGKNIYTYHFNDFSFDETRFVNANIDYGERINEGIKHILLYRLPGNNFSMFQNDTSMNGIININDAQVHEVDIITSDFNGNTASVKMSVRTPMEKVRAKINSDKHEFPPGNFISYKKAPVIKQSNLKISFASPVTYSVYPFKIKREKKMKGTYSSLYSIGDKTIPIHTFMNLSIKPVNLLPELYSKALIVNINKKNILTAETSTFADGWVTGKIKHFGSFTIAIDTTPPKIKLPEIVMDTILNTKKLVIEISDNLSGIKSYKVTREGNWLLMEYDAKTGTLNYELKKEDAGKKAELIIEVTDRKENKSELKTTIDFGE